MNVPRLADNPQCLSDVRGIVFDKDGTLTDLSERWHVFFESLVRGAVAAAGIGDAAAMLRAIGVADGRLVPNGMAAVGRGTEIRDTLTAALESEGLSHQSATDALMAGREGATFGALRPMGDIVSSLASIADSGIRVGVATADVRSNTTAELAELGIDRFISAVRCGDDDGPVKPDGAVLHGIASEWRIEARHLVFVGDSEGDAATARSADVAFIAVGGDTAADAWVELIAEIAELL